MKRSFIVPSVRKRTPFTKECLSCFIILILIPYQDKVFYMSHGDHICIYFNFNPNLKIQFNQLEF